MLAGTFQTTDVSMLSYHIHSTHQQQEVEAALKLRSWSVIEENWCHVVLTLTREQTNTNIQRELICGSAETTSSTLNEI